MIPSKSNLLLLTAILMITFSCKKKEGCNDPKALNFDSSVEKENNNECQFSTATFYASGNSFSGSEVSEIVLTLGQTNESIGTITSFNQPYPENCSSTGTVQYTFTTGNSQVWFATYKLVAGGDVTAQGEFEPSSSNSCLKIDVLH